MGRRRILVPFDLGTSMRAPFGYTRRMRAEDRAKRPRVPSPTRRDVVRVNLFFLAFYLTMAVGGLLGWWIDHVWIAALGGVVAGAATFGMVVPVAMAIRSSVSRRADRRAAE